MACGNLTIDCSDGLTLDDLCNEVSFEGTDFLREEERMMQERAEHRAKSLAVFGDALKRRIIEDIQNNAKEIANGLR